VLIKPNIGGFDWFKDPKTHDGDDGVRGRTTNPEFVRGIIRCLKKRGHTKITVTEGWGATHKDWEKHVDVGGFAKMTKEEGVPLLELNAESVAAVQKMGPLEANTLAMAPAPPEVLESAPRVGDFVFSTRDNRPVSGFAKMKSRIDSFIGEGMADWTLHDLRRTGATLLQRLNFSREVIDACRNHRPSGVSLIYQRYAFRTEKEAQAFEALAREVERITNGEPSNVVAMVRHAT
jgi:integrase